MYSLRQRKKGLERPSWERYIGMHIRQIIVFAGAGLDTVALEKQKIYVGYILA